MRHYNSSSLFKGNMHNWGKVKLLLDNWSQTSHVQASIDVQCCVVGAKTRNHIKFEAQYVRVILTIILL